MAVLLTDRIADRSVDRETLYAHYSLACSMNKLVSWIRRLCVCVCTHACVNRMGMLNVLCNVFIISSHYTSLVSAKLYRELNAIFLYKFSQVVTIVTIIQRWQIIKIIHYLFSFLRAIDTMVWHVRWLNHDHLGMEIRRFRKGHDSIAFEEIHIYRMCM